MPKVSYIFLMKSGSRGYLYILHPSYGLNSFLYRYPVVVASGVNMFVGNDVNLHQHAQLLNMKVKLTLHGYPKEMKLIRRFAEDRNL